MIVNEIRVRVPVELLQYKSLLEVGVRHLAACELFPELRRGDPVKQARVKLSDSALATVRMLATRPGWSESRIVWAALVMAARCRLNVDTDNDRDRRRREPSSTAAENHGADRDVPSSPECTPSAG